MISRPLLPLAMLFLTMPLLSCGTVPTPVLQSSASAVKAVPCVEIPVIRWHSPTTLPEAKAWTAGTLPDPGNVYDTPSTVRAIRLFNAARGAVCGP